MNIFVLDLDPIKAAQYHNDKHCVKMVLETAQLLSSAHHILDSPFKDVVYKLTHKNHPCALWVRESKDNYTWLFMLFEALAIEYRLRYGRQHKSWVTKSEYLQYNPIQAQKDLTPFPLCMPDNCKILGDPVASYRNYYIKEKAHIAKWKTGVPYWWPVHDIQKNNS